MSKKRDLQRVDRVAKKHGFTPEQRRDFGRYIETCKRGAGYDLGNDGDALEHQLEEMAEEFKNGIR